MASSDAKKFDELDAQMRPLAKRLHENHMACLGIRNTMRLALAYNQAKFQQQDELRRSLYQDRWKKLIDENGPITRKPVEMNDGWGRDDSRTLPHLDRVLEDSRRIISERSGTRRSSPGAYRSYFQDVWTPEDLERYPSFLDFATSSELLSVVGAYLGCVPALSTTLPSGIRFVESNAAFDDQPDKPHDSQLYHLDYYSLPNLYVLVLLEDTTSEHGPWTFLPRSISQEASSKLGNWGPGHGYRFTDEEVYSVVDRRHAIEFTGARGSVMFIESSGCMHFGSRNSVKPRFQLMLGYTGVCRTDFSELIMMPKVYPVRTTDSTLRKLVLDKNALL
ncbi:MAG: hypothetical protein KF691_09340 [Phycisphaeraceae bacterium]|nr:hypothetical protein [Phycisphaeraceae bacterium]